MGFLHSIFNLLYQGIDLFLHIDRHLEWLIGNYGPWTYLLLFVVVFCETGLVAIPFLPGDSLLFAAGTFAARDWLNPHLIVLILAAAAILGDTVNYWIGHFVGPRVFTDRVRWFKKEHLLRTQRFYEKHGGKTIVLARFVPIIRTFAPFVAGIGAMSYGRFIAYNVTGGIAWVCLGVYSGFFFGNIAVVRNNFSLVIVAIVLISVLPIVIEYLRQRREGPAKAEDPAPAKLPPE